ncbi:hypothetical protein JHK85_053367 [Glycine max]|nr:hypothetical protein JHK85_053367 [Glycine max]
MNSSPWKKTKIYNDEVNVSLGESTQTCEACITLKEKESKLCLKIETSAGEKATLLKNFQELENELNDLQKDLKELNELHHKIEERYNLWRECAQAQKHYEDLKISKHNLWVECEEHKKSVKFLNDELSKNKECKGQPQDVQSQASTRRDGLENQRWTTHQRQGRRKPQGVELENLGDLLNDSLRDTSSLSAIPSRG